MLSPRLHKFLSAWCDAEDDPADVIKPLHDSPTTGWAVWLQDDLRDLIRDNDLTTVKARRMTGLAFQSQEDVDDWLAGLWELWFPMDPVPAPVSGTGDGTRI